MIKNKKVLVTGGAGTVGCNIVKKLVEREADVTVIDKDPNLMNGLEIQFSLVFYHVFLLNNKTTFVFLITEKVEEILIKVSQNRMMP